VINAANPGDPGTGGTTCELTDQRGYLRYDVRCDIGAVEYNTGPSVFRVSGANRYDTAAAVSQFDFPAPAQVSTVFVAVGTNYPDALAGAAIAGKIGAPLLLVTPNSIPAETATELTRLAPDDIVILGGLGAISQQVEDDLAPYATNPITRLAGADRFATAVAISQYGFSVDGSADTVFVATGRGFADALAAGPVAVQLNGPVLLTEKDTLPAVVGTEIVRLTPSRIIVVGGTAAVSDAVVTALDALQVGDVVERIAGADRYATAAAISAEGFEFGALRVYLATGLNFPDALGAAAGGMTDPCCWCLDQHSTATSAGSPPRSRRGSSSRSVVSQESKRPGHTHAAS
jgi:putative cell wall-binding protein